MPIYPDIPTLIDLDRGELIKIEKDTDHLWRLKDPVNPISGLTLEAGGRCYYYQFEHGVWYCSEYHGNLNRVPQFKIKFEASEPETREREAARMKWESQHGGATNNTGTMPVGGMGGRGTGAPGFTTVPGIAGTVSQGVDHGMGMPQSGTTTSTSGYGPGFPQAATQTQSRAHFPQASVNMHQQSIGAEKSQGFSTPGNFPSANTSTNAVGLEFPGHSGYHHHNRVPPVASFPPSFPFGPDAPPPQSPSFPPSFPFAPDAPWPQAPFPSAPGIPAPHSPSLPSPPPFPNQPSMPTGPPSMPSAHNSDRRAVFTDGNYLNVGGQINTTSTDNPTVISGHGETVNWRPDYHKELNGTYDMNWHH